jgi:hypothetical protein
VREVAPKTKPAADTPTEPVANAKVAKPKVAKVAKPKAARPKVVAIKGDASEIAPEPRKRLPKG